MRRKTSRIVLFIVMLTAAAVIVLIKRDEDASPLRYIKKESAHHSFVITKNNEVKFTEEIHIQNASNRPQKFKGIGVYSNNFKNGLLAAERLNGFTDSDQPEILELGAQAQQTFSIDFLGEKGAAHMKQDRSPPEEILFIFIKK
ncbi:MULTISPECIES: hypothetical protein [Saccharibacillus]|uniref:hypothetical protein n=1 Tax=Saccharibacillus TaxID=456492 RepID=UPI00123C43EF|nr:hypothetical protein [Saccharibacillus sp. WB 17]MWJ31385.1 hypothetical protein [Saccharibacillus sp. WB 17]